MIEEHKPFLMFRYLVKSLKQLSKSKGEKEKNIVVVYNGYGNFLFFLVLSPNLPF